jgi:dihydrofolate reductase
MTVTCIAAVSENGVIGRNGSLPWKLPADLRRFKARTMGKTLILGRKTWDTLAGPLPGRRIVVVTRRPPFDAPDVEHASSVEDALALCRGEDEVMIGGGEQIYRAALPFTDTVDLTWVHARFEGDAHFPLEGLGAFRLVSDERHAADAKNPWDYSFRLYVREPPA